MVSLNFCKPCHTHSKIWKTRCKEMFAKKYLIILVNKIARQMAWGGQWASSHCRLHVPCASRRPRSLQKRALACASICSMRNQESDTTVSRLYIHYPPPSDAARLFSSVIHYCTLMAYNSQAFLSSRRWINIATSDFYSLVFTTAFRYLIKICSLLLCSMLSPCWGEVGRYR